MKWSSFALVALPLIATSALTSNLVEKDYLQFADPRELIPKNPQFAKVIEGDLDGCLTQPNQTKPVTIAQIKTLKTVKTTREAIALLGNSFCETARSLRYVTETGKDLNISLDTVLDYDFSSATTTTTKARGLLQRLPVRAIPKNQEPKKTVGDR